LDQSSGEGSVAFTGLARTVLAGACSPEPHPRMPTEAQRRTNGSYDQALGTQ
jgi:hypothetical protein